MSSRLGDFSVTGEEKKQNVTRGANPPAAFGLQHGADAKENAPGARHGIGYSVPSGTSVLVDALQTPQIYSGLRRLAVVVLLMSSFCVSLCWSGGVGPFFTVLAAWLSSFVVVVLWFGFQITLAATTHRLGAENIDENIRMASAKVIQASDGVRATSNDAYEQIAQLRNELKTYAAGMQRVVHDTALTVTELSESTARRMQVAAITATVGYCMFIAYCVIALCEMFWLVVAKPPKEEKVTESFLSRRHEQTLAWWKRMAHHVMNPFYVGLMYSNWLPNLLGLGPPLTFGEAAALNSQISFGLNIGESFAFWMTGFARLFMNLSQDEPQEWTALDLEIKRNQMFRRFDPMSVEPAVAPRHKRKVVSGVPSKLFPMEPGTFEIPIAKCCAEHRTRQLTHPPVGFTPLEAYPEDRTVSRAHYLRSVDRFSSAVEALEVKKAVSWRSAPEPDWVSADVFCTADCVGGCSLAADVENARLRKAWQEELSEGVCYAVGTPVDAATTTKVNQMFASPVALPTVPNPPGITIVEDPPMTGVDGSAREAQVAADLRACYGSVGASATPPPLPPLAEAASGTSKKRPYILSPRSSALEEKAVKLGFQKPPLAEGNYTLATLQRLYHEDMDTFVREKNAQFERGKNVGKVKWIWGQIKLGVLEKIWFVYEWYLVNRIIFWTAFACLILVCLLLFTRLFRWCSQRYYAWRTGIEGKVGETFWVPSGGGRFDGEVTVYDPVMKTKVTFDPDDSLKLDAEMRKLVDAGFQPTVVYQGRRHRLTPESLRPVPLDGDTVALAVQKQADAPVVAKMKDNAVKAKTEKSKVPVAQAPSKPKSQPPAAKPSVPTDEQWAKVVAGGRTVKTSESSDEKHADPVVNQKKQWAATGKTTPWVPSALEVSPEPKKSETRGDMPQIPPNLSVVQLFHDGKFIENATFVGNHIVCTAHEKTGLDPNKFAINNEGHVVGLVPNSKPVYPGLDLLRFNRPQVENGVKLCGVSVKALKIDTLPPQVGDQLFMYAFVPNEAGQLVQKLYLGVYRGLDGDGDVKIESSTEAGNCGAAWRTMKSGNLIAIHARGGSPGSGNNFGVPVLGPEIILWTQGKNPSAAPPAQ